MAEIKKEEGQYITLKEAAKISGYTPDYLGQLIRKGKLEGKQIYLNVAWVTTEKALSAYLENNKMPARKAELGIGIRGKARRWVLEHNSGEEIIRLTRKVIYVVLGILFLLCLFLIYAFFANALHAGKFL
jgi:hypothetical protein